MFCGTDHVNGIVMASSNDPNARRPALPRRGKKSGGKPIRLADLIPSKDVKGGARTVFGAPGMPPQPNRSNEKNK